MTLFPYRLHSSRFPYTTESTDALTLNRQTASSAFGPRELRATFTNAALLWRLALNETEKQRYDHEGFAFVNIPGVQIFKGSK